MQSKDNNQLVSFLEEIDNYYGKKFSVSDLKFISDEYTSWKDAIYCTANHYSDTPLLKFGLSTRTYNSLRRKGYDTVGSVFVTSIYDLEKVGNFGNTSLEELIRMAIILIKSFIDENPNLRLTNNIIANNERGIIGNQVIQSSLESNNAFDLLVRNIFSGEEEVPDPNLLINHNERLFLKRLNQAIDEVGFEICALAYREREKINDIIPSFSRFIINQENYQKIRALLVEIPNTRLTKKLFPFVILYGKLSHKTLDDEIFDNIFLVKDLEANIGYLSEQNCQKFITLFIKWLSFDISEIAQIFLDRIATKEKQLDIITRRASGETLEEISMIYSVTRERIRQIENQTIQEFRKYLRSYPLLSFISAELNGETIITFNNIVDIIPNSEVIFYLLKKNPDSPFAYDKRLSCFYLPGKTEEKFVADLISGLPAIIFEAERENILQEVKQKTNAQEKLIYLVFKRRFKQVGKIWQTGRLNKGAMYGFIIEKFFPHGIRIYQKQDLARFRKHIHELFGEENISTSDRAFWGIVQRVCILCDRGKYIHPSYVSIPDELLNRIESYFISSGRTSMAFHELFDEFKDELIIEANITNRYLLQGLFKEKIGDKYYYYKDGISTDPDIKITSEIEAYVSENSPVTKQELMKAFSGITEAMLAQNLARLPSIILLENGTYADAEKFDIIADDFKIRLILQRCTKKYPITASKLLESLYISHPDFLQRNDIHSSDTLFSILQYMFSDDFSFSRPNIASLEEGSVTTGNFLLTLLNDKEEVNIDDLKLLCDEYHINYPSQNLMISALMDYYLQIDVKTLLDIKRIDISTDSLNKIKQLVYEDIGMYGFKPLYLIDNFIFYPDIGPQWTPILLRSIIIKYFSSCFNVVSNRRMETDIIIDKKIDADNYKDLVQFIVRREQKRDPFTNFEGLISWLVDLGLLNKEVISPNNDGEERIVQSKLPNFLRDGSFITSDQHKLIFT